MRLLSVMLVLVALAAAGCGSSTQTATTKKAAVTKAAVGTSTAPASPAQTATAAFVLHAELAFGAFHRYIYTPLKAGELKSLAGHSPVVARAAAAAFLVGRELKRATAAAKASPALNKLDTQLAILSDGFTAALVRLKAGHFNPVEIQTAASAIEGIEHGAAAAGAPLAERVPAVP